MADEIRVAPSTDDAYRLILPASLLLAVFLGFALGIHIAVSRLTEGGDAGRNADLLQAHGQVQLLGFAGLYVMGMSLRLLPRFSGAKVAFPALVPLILVAFLLGLIPRAVILPFLTGDAHDMLLLLSVAGVLAGSCGFFLVIAGTARDARKADPSVIAFGAGAAFLLLSSIVALATTVDAVGEGLRTPTLLDSQALLQMQLGGFVMLFIAGVAIRAIPTMVGAERPERGASVLLVASIAGAVLVLAAALLYIEHVDDSRLIARAASLAFVLLGLSFVSLSWRTGALRSSANRLRPASQAHLWLVRSALAWLVIAGVVAVYSGATAAVEGTLPAQFEFDAVRHILGIGVITGLIAGMSLMIVPEFAMDRRRTDQRGLALLLFALVNTATLLRVAPSIAGTAWTFDQRNISMAVAGTLAEVALIVFAVSLLRLRAGGRLQVGGSN